MSGQRRLFLSNALRVSSNWLSQAALTHQAGAVGAHTFASISSQPAEEQHASLASTSALPSYLSWAAASEQVATSSGRGEGGFKLALPNSPFAASGRRGRPSPKLILYKGPYLLLFRFLVRGKVFQLLGVFLAAMVIAAAFTAPGSFTTFDIFAALSVMVGCVVTSYCIWFYSSRYVGELSLLLPERRVARFSVLDFWGNRQDIDVPIEQIYPPFKDRSIAQVKRMVSNTLMPIHTEGDRQFYISVRHGTILQKEVLQKLCYGVWLEELDKDSRNEGGANVQAGSTQDAGSQQGHESTEDGSVQSGQAVLGKSKSESREQ